MLHVIDEGQTGRVNTHQSQYTFQVYFSSQSGGPDISDCLNQARTVLKRLKFTLGWMIDGGELLTKSRTTGAAPSNDGRTSPKLERQDTPTNMNHVFAGTKR